MGMMLFSFHAMQWWCGGNANSENSLHLFDFFAPRFWVVLLPFISEDSEDAVGEEDGKSQAPDESDGVEEVGVAGACVDPEVVEGWAKETGVQQG